MKEAPRSRPSLMRRYPALAFVVAAGALALLLPSALHVPQSGPTTLAEFAPVSGEGQGKGDVSDLGQASSGGLGFGSGSRSGANFSEPPNFGGPKQKGRTLKRCVGSPPRQTEDPLSPPCVAFFEGDNAGATWRGVSREAAVVVIHLLDSQPGISDCTKPILPEDTRSDKVCKAFWRFFNSRYQTYGRNIRLFAYHAGNSRGAVNDKNDIVAIESELRPFAIVPTIPSGGGREFAAEAAGRGMLVAGYRAFSRATYLRHPRLLISFAPDLEDESKIVSEYICNKLAGRPARYSGNPLDVDKPRKFGVWHERNEERSPMLQSDLERTCGIKVVDVDDASTAVATMRAGDVTTVIPLSINGQPIIYTNAAQSQGWSPEWFIPGDPLGEGLDTAGNARLYNQPEWRHAFGVSFDYRRDARGEQSYHRALKEGCPECADDVIGAPLYDALTMLFYGIQAAGPKLTPESIDRGLHAIPPSKSTSPYRPAAYFSPGNFSFIKDAAEIWWDSVAPAQDNRVGCYRLPNEGQRNRAGDWTGDDSSLFSPGAPCQAPF